MPSRPLGSRCNEDDDLSGLSEVKASEAVALVSSSSRAPHSSVASGSFPLEVGGIVDPVDVDRLQSIPNQGRKRGRGICAWISTALAIVAGPSMVVLSRERLWGGNYASAPNTKPMKYECSDPEAERDRERLSQPQNNTPSFVPFKVLDECGLAASCRELRPLGKSLGFLKTHKTGSSTISNLVNRVVDSRNLTKMIPKNFIKLGWPGVFPGDNVLPCNDKYDAISNHAVWNAKQFSKHLRDPMFSLTILRDPMSRLVSAFNYFGNFDSWRECIEVLHSSKKRKASVVRYLNSIAFDLGWYDLHSRGNGLNTDFDRNTDAIQSFIRQLDQEMDVVMITEYMTESLLMLSMALPSLNPQELVLYSMKQNTEEPKYPNATEMEELARFLSVDQLIYDHFEKKLLDWWGKNEQSEAISQKKDALECLQHWAGNHTHSIYASDSVEYTSLLWTKQRPLCSKK